MNRDSRDKEPGDPGAPSPPNTTRFNIRYQRGDGTYNKPARKSKSEGSVTQTVDNTPGFKKSLGSEDEGEDRDEDGDKVEDQIMSSGRNRPRNGPRGGGGGNDIYQELWDECRDILPDISRAANRSNTLSKETIEMNHQLGAKQANGVSITDADISTFDGLFRDNLKTIDKLTNLTNPELLNKLKLLRDHKLQEELAAKARQEAALAARATSRSSAMDYDGPSDSPGPSIPDEKPPRSKGGGSSRTSSQPPNPPRSSLPPSEPGTGSSRNSVTKIIYAVGDNVAFKRKPLNPDSPTDWIQGTVCQVIGEGKSRRYQVRDDEPDPGAPQSYRTSAGQMVRIPPIGSVLSDYEPGKVVLALYPDTTTFYRAQVKSMVEGGLVQLIFEDPENSKPPPVNVARRFVLDHKG